MFHTCSLTYSWANESIFQSAAQTKITSNDYCDVISYNEWPTFGSFPSKTVRLILLLLLPHWPHQMTGMGFLKSLSSWYFFVNMIGQVSQDADAVLHWLNGGQWQKISFKAVSVSQAFTLANLQFSFQNKMHWWQSMDNLTHTLITLMISIICRYMQFGYYLIFMLY